MIYRLRKKFIKICMLSFAITFLALFSIIYLTMHIQTNASLDTLADLVAKNDGKFPNVDDLAEMANPMSLPQDIDRESPFTTRYFSVYFDENDAVVSVDTRSIASVAREEAIVYAATALESGYSRGWVGDFRYKVFDSANGTAAVFINGAAMQDMNRRFLLSASSVFIGGGLVVLCLVVLFSYRAVKPTVESYEKQKQFITDANHELKTPLTLIRTNLEIMEAEYGSNEWLSDIREETDTMVELVDRLVTLSRMDEDGNYLVKQSFQLSEAIYETITLFFPLIRKNHLKLVENIVPGVEYIGNERSIRQLISILMDNAVKYCDPEGRIEIALFAGKHPVLAIENTYTTIQDLPLGRLFDRFYRGDKVRRYGNGFGIGLSIAQAIVEKHHGTITVSQGQFATICFQVRL